MRFPAASLTVLALGALLLAAPLPAAEVRKHVVEKSFAFSLHTEIPVGVRVGEVTIDSFRIRNGPNEEDFEKARKDPDDSHSADIEFRYSNRNESRDYKCRYTVVVLGPTDGTVYAESDRTQTLDKGKMGDTNKVSVKMKTRNFRLARTVKVEFEIWKD